MTIENEAGITSSVDYFEEFDVVMESVLPEELQKLAPVTVEQSPRQRELLEGLQEILAELLADHAFWATPSLTAFDAFCRLRDLMKERLGQYADHRPSSDTLSPGNGASLSALSKETKHP